MTTSSAYNWIQRLHCLRYSTRGFCLATVGQLSVSSHHVCAPGSQLDLKDATAADLAVSLWPSGS